MNNELIERIDEWLATHFVNAEDAAILFSECKAEIKWLEKARRYIPMTDDELSAVSEPQYHYMIRRSNNALHNIK